MIFPNSNQLEHQTAPAIAHAAIAAPAIAHPAIAAAPVAWIRR